MRALNQTPDKPESFGYKVLWFAIKTPDPAAVIDALQLTEAKPANWASGLATAYESSRSDDPWVFVSPPVEGWVFAISLSLPYPAVESHHGIGQKFDIALSRLIERFGDVQFFGSHRVSGFCTWARATKGMLERAFTFGDEVVMNFGQQTPEEAELDFADISGLSEFDAENRLSAIVGEQIEHEERLEAEGLSHEEARERVRENGRFPFPDEGDVVELAGLWSIDPTHLSEQDHPVGLGLVARLPEYLRP
jgi:hypothetical protein